MPKVSINQHEIKVIIDESEFEKLPEYVQEILRKNFPELFSFKAELERAVFRFWTKKLKMNEEKCIYTCQFCILSFMSHICRPRFLEKKLAKIFG